MITDRASADPCLVQRPVGEQHCLDVRVGIAKHLADLRTQRDGTVWCLDQHVEPRHAEDDIGGGEAAQIKSVIAGILGTAHDQVIAGLIDDHIVARERMDHVIASARPDHVISTACRQNVIAR